MEEEKKREDRRRVETREEYEALYNSGMVQSLPVCTGTEGCSVSWLAVGCLSPTVASTGKTNTHKDHS